MAPIIIATWNKLVTTRTLPRAEHGIRAEGKNILSLVYAETWLRHHRAVRVLPRIKDRETGKM